jgi:O-acetyl-ADP-ribose deacetylase (regulator of RNase III)
VLTGGGRLPSRFVIHTVGPVWTGGGQGEADVLARCYRNCLRLAAQRSLASVAFPSISTGAYGYPVEAAAEVALRTVREAALEGLPVGLVRFVLFSEDDLRAYAAALASLPE